MNKNFGPATYTEDSMRRSALHVTIPLVCALLGVVLVAASGKADEQATSTLPPLAMAYTPAPAPAFVPSAAPALTLPPTTRPAPARALAPAAAAAKVEPAEMLITSAPLKVDAPAAVLLRAKPRTIMMEVTAYCACKKCCGPKAQGITASGKRVNFNGGLFVAADKKVFDFHTKLKIPGYANGQSVPVLDRGGAIKGNKLDVFFPSHAQALKWGRQRIPVTVVD